MNALSSLIYAISELRIDIEVHVSSCSWENSSRSLPLDLKQSLEACPTQPVVSVCAATLQSEAVCENDRTVHTETSPVYLFV